MLTAAPGNGLLNSNTCSWLICLLSKRLGWPKAILLRHANERCPCTGGQRIGQAARHTLEKHCGMVRRHFGVPRATAARRDCGEDGLRTEWKRNIPSGHCLHLIVPRKQAFTSGVIPVSVCVSGRTGILPLNHQVLLQRCSWGSASLWHHKVRPNSYGSHISVLLHCFTILSTLNSVLHFKGYSLLAHYCFFIYLCGCLLYLQKGHL